MSRFWGILGKYREGREQLEGALSSVPDPDVKDEATSEATEADWTEDKELALAKGRALFTVGEIAHNQVNLADARVNIEKALEMARYAGDRMLIADCLNNLAMLASMAGDYVSEQSLHNESLAVLRETGDMNGMAILFKNQGYTAQLQDDYASARSLYERSLTLAREGGNASLVADVLGDLGTVAYEQEDYATARSLLEESLAVLRETGNRTGIAYCLYYLGMVTDAQGDHAHAASLYKDGLAMHREAEDMFGIVLCLAGLGDWAGVRKRQKKEQREHMLRLLGAASVQFEAIGYVLRPRDRLRYEQGLSLSRAQLGEEVFEKARAEGRAMSMEEAIEYALQESS
jgi:tetratricopeptide (TPR) repeat protein